MMAIKRDPTVLRYTRKGMRRRIQELEKCNAQLEERIREWDNARSRIRDLYLEVARILDLPDLPCIEDDDDCPDLPCIEDDNGFRGRHFVMD